MPATCITPDTPTPLTLGAAEPSSPLLLLIAGLLVIVCETLLKRYHRH